MDKSEVSKINISEKLKSIFINQFIVVIKGMRSGTVPTPLVVGLGAAAKICKEELEVAKLLVLFYEINVVLYFDLSLIMKEYQN